MKLTIEKAEARDCRRLTDISIRSFHSDAELNSGHPDYPGKEVLLKGGPPGYDSEEWHRKLTGQGIVRKIIYGDALIGGAIAYPAGPERMELGRIFIDPEYQGQNLGLQTMGLLEEMLPTRIWQLETPAWNTRTRRFYQKAGYRIVKEDSGEIYFEKEIG